MNEFIAAELIDRAEETGRLEKGMQIEHFVGGGGPPPYYRLEQLRLTAQDGHPEFRFVTPDFTAPGKQGERYPNHIYTLPATPDEIRTMARLVRESGVFNSPALTFTGGPVRDRVRTEVAVVLDKTAAQRVFPTGEPPELAKLQAFVNPIIARLKKQGRHRIE